MLSRRAGLSAIAGLSCILLLLNQSLRYTDVLLQWTGNESLSCLNELFFIFPVRVLEHNEIRSLLHVPLSVSGCKLMGRWGPVLL